MHWYGTGPTVDMGPDSRTLAYHLRGGSQQDVDLYVMINASASDVTFEIQEGRPDEWRQVFDTGLTSPNDFHEPGSEACIRSSAYVVRSRSVVGLIRGRAASRGMS